ncbi:RHS repeat domain-containing protein [Gallaecimonas mangrovi]|uniref:RHS repeat domain-containing protein n=1 Tax=Gallaecimonas mangrovi TaxID=2291597 RepID=UPI000E20A782|nr:RHS repeat domain-containing protein [Gallaecimonas mangrovi]
MVHNIAYDSFDVYGNLSHRENLATGLSEDFTYDALQRLTSRSLDTDSTSLSVTYSYDAAGNLTSKSDYASQYSYDSSKPNAVASITKLDGSTASFLPTTPVAICAAATVEP